MRLQSAGAKDGTDIKTGLGGIRDVEFLVQGLQLIHAPEHPELPQGNTLKALGALVQAGIMDRALADELKDDYLFLRRIEHCLQILEDQQIHALPRDPAHLTALARRVLGVDGDRDTFQQRLAECQERVHQAYIHGLSLSGAIEA